MNKYLEKIAELRKEAMRPERVLAATKKKGKSRSDLLSKMYSKREDVALNMLREGDSSGLKGKQYNKIQDNIRKIWDAQ